MYTINVNHNTYEIVPENGPTYMGTINGEHYEMNMAQKDATNWIVESDGIEHRVEVVHLDTNDKVAIIRINGRKYSVNLKDRFDQLLKDLGMENLSVKKVSEIKSPMPGMVLDILVQPGDVIKKGDQVVVLEAMKMENILKSPSDAVVKSIHAEQGKSVEKGQVLVKFE